MIASSPSYNLQELLPRANLLPGMSDTREILEHAFREEYGAIISSLIRRSGSFDLAEESLQEAFSTALTSWQHNGVPQKPAAWLTTVAQRKLLDALRREKTRTDKEAQLTYESTLKVQPFEIPEDQPEYPDDRLRLIFTCCHPSLSLEAQIALTLRTLGGLTTTEIANAFLTPESTMAQRLVRAKNKIRLAKIPYEVPRLEVIAERLQSVQSVIYLIFNEGYSASTGESLVRQNLCFEAIRLARLLHALIPDDNESTGLLSLMLLQHSRRNARVDRFGELLTLEEQDRSLWDRQAIDEGLKLIEEALTSSPVGYYQLQAAIAAVHAEATTSEDTDWAQIVALYGEMLRFNSSPIVLLNRAVAVAMANGVEKGLKLIEDIEETRALDGYYVFYAAKADLLRRLNRIEEAMEAYSQASRLAGNSVTAKFLQRRLHEVTREANN